MATFPSYPTHPGGDSAGGGSFGHPHWWQRRWVRYGALITLLALSGLVILALVRQQTGTEGFLVGLGLAVLPVPLLIAAFRWLDRVAPGPWRNLIFAFAWGACAAALIAIVANSFATRWIATATADPHSADTLGATVIAPIVEESAKAAAVLLVFLFRRRDFTGIVDGVVIAGVTATGFAFTENILYLGTAFGTDQMSGGSGLASVTAATFFVRVVMSPFAHPLFTVLTGIGFGIAALSAERRHVWRVPAPLGGLLLAMGMHSMWNGSSTFGQYGFFAVYASFMVPAFGLLTWLVIWTRQRELRTVREELPAYVVAGWMGPVEPFVLGSMRARRLAREYARQHFGKDAARSVARYEAYATSLAFLRHRGRRGRVSGDFVVRERELLTELWARREVARPALAYAARATAPVAPPVWPGYGHVAFQGAPRYGPATPQHGPATPQYGPAMPQYGPAMPQYGPAAPYPGHNPYQS
ncbi:PrsW family intramembrane metalloprotease [Streptomyces sp. Ru72]|uniref:PrsW family intramembrane metalloprotease n=1 Tax=Streptomyces sp. Ru72 TaxID=2080747 RepID=UPI000CDD5028|nr:PrsW family intramembrane metalloprotease [Streptomyces sp. Ru72]POX49478.1 PrsW family intramembrane metalloprotease [Streptomyces sp. Ru72]